jgi:hypothetical protein
MQLFVEKFAPEELESHKEEHFSDSAPLFFIGLFPFIKRKYLDATNKHYPASVEDPICPDESFDNRTTQHLLATPSS